MTVNDIYNYIGNNSRMVSVGYLKNGLVKRIYRKIEGTNHEEIAKAIQEIKNQGKPEVSVEVYHPNGSAWVVKKKFIIPNEKSGMGNVPTLFDTATKTEQKQPSVQSPSKSQPMENNSWKDYALTTEKERVKKLEAEVLRLTTKNEQLDSAVREFEKAMIKKDYEIEKASIQLSHKAGLAGIAEDISKNDKIMNLLGTVAERIMGVPASPSQGAISGQTQTTNNPKLDQYLANIRMWLEKQPEELQDQFYQLIVDVTGSGEVSANILKIIELIKNGTLTNLKRTA